MAKLLDVEISFDILQTASFVLQAVLILKEEASVDEVSHTALGHLRPVLLLVLLFLNCLESSNMTLQVFERRCWRHEGGMLDFLLDLLLTFLRRLADHS